MKTAFLLYSIMAVGLAFTASSAKAQSKLSDEDVRRLVAHYRTFTYKLQQPVTVYHWLKAEDEPKGPWLKKFSPNTPEALSYAKVKASEFWQSRTTSMEDPYNAFGTALYAELDPVNSFSSAAGEGEGECEHENCGGGTAMVHDVGPNWVLMQIGLPKGLTILNLARDNNNSNPMQIQAFLDRANCPAKWNFDKMGPRFGRLFHADSNLSGECQDALTRVFRDQLKISAIVVEGGSRVFKECVNPPDPTLEDNTWISNKPWRNARVALVSGDFLTQEMIRAYNPKSTEDRANRQTIQSLYYRSFHDKTERYFATPELSMDYIRHNDWSLLPGKALSEDSTCEKFKPGLGCTGKVKVCARTESFEVDLKKCERVPAPHGKGYPVVMSNKNPPEKSDDPNSMSGKLLWKDLEGVQADAKIGAWIQQNLYGCSEAIPFKRQK